MLTEEVDAARGKLGRIAGMLSEVASSVSKAREIGSTPAAALGEQVINDFRAAAQRLEQQLGVGS